MKTAYRTRDMFHDTVLEDAETHGGGLPLREVTLSVAIYVVRV